MRNLCALAWLLAPCTAESRPTWVPLSEYAFDSEVVVFAQFHKTVPPTINDAAGKTIYRVAEVFRQKETDNRLRKGDLIERSPCCFWERGDTFLLARRGGEWQAPREFSRAAYSFLTEMPSRQQSPSRWLAYHCRHLSAKDDTLEEQVFLELRNLPFATLTAARDQFDAATLRRHLVDPKTKGDRHAIYAMMLAACGGKQDVAALQRIVLQPTESQSLSLEAIAFAYLHLGRKPALQLLERQVLVPQRVVIDGKRVDVSALQKYAVICAIRNGLASRQRAIDRPRLLKSVRLALRHCPKLSAELITTLTRQREFSLLREIERIRGGRDLFAATLEHVIACIKHDGDNERVQQARRHVRRAWRVNPTLTRSVFRSAGLLE